MHQAGNLNPYLVENWEDQSLDFPTPLNRSTSVPTLYLKFFSGGKFTIQLN